MERLRDVPAILVQGRRDLVCPPGTAYTLREQWPGAQLRMVEEGGHSALHPAHGAGAGPGHARYERASDDDMSLRFRINLIITVLIVLFSLVTAKIVVDDARRSIREEMEAGTKVTQQLLTTMLYSSRFVPPTEDPNYVLRAFLHSLGRVRANEIRLYKDDGTLVYTSPPPVYKAGRAAPHWFSAPGHASSCPRSS